MNITVIGIGLMGYPMAGRVKNAGHEVTVYNRTLEKTKGLAEIGIKVAGSITEAIKASEVIVLVLSEYAAVKEVMFSGEPLDLKGKTIIQMGTISSRESRELQSAVNGQGGEYMECPVLGSRKEARAGHLILMVGASARQFERWEGFLKCFGPKPIHVGAVGAAAVLKLAFNQLIASHAAAFSLSLGMVERNGIDPDLFMDMLRASALHAPMFDKKFPGMRARNFENPNFPVKHLLKDVNLILTSARADGLNVDHLEGVKKVLEEAMAQGRAELDYSAVYDAISKKGE